MSAEAFNPVPAARRLARMWRDLTQMDALPVEERPRTLREAYALQSALMREIGEPVRGYKMGLSSAAAMERSGLGAPIMGFVPQSRIYASGATLEIPASGVLLEAEVAFTLQDNGPASGNPQPEARLAFEIVRSRFARRTEVDLMSFVGDASGFHALVVGDAIPVEKLYSLIGGGAVIRHGGRTVATAVTGRECPDPPDVIRMFRDLAARHDMPVESGMIVATGSLVIPFETNADGQFEAQLGASSVRFTARHSP